MSPGKGSRASSSAKSPVRRAQPTPALKRKSAASCSGNSSACTRREPTATPAARPSVEEGMPAQHATPTSRENAMMQAPKRPMQAIRNHVPNTEATTAMAV